MDNGVRRAIVSVNTCNTKNFGFQDPPRPLENRKAYCLTSNGYPTSDGLTHRTYLIEYEEIDELLCKETQG